MALKHFMTCVAHVDLGVNPDLAPNFAPANTETVILAPLVIIHKNVIKQGVKPLFAVSLVPVAFGKRLNHLSHTVAGNL